jgi:hypothetical protein
MDFEGILSELRKMAILPEKGTKNYEVWLESQDFINFLRNSKDGEIPLYVSFKDLYLYSVVIPIKQLKDQHIADLLEWNCDPSNSWGYSHFFSARGNPVNISISGPFWNAGSKILEKAQPITYLRSFEGRIGKKGYIECSQYLAHLHGLHFDEARNAYCCLDKNGDVEEAIKIYHKEEGILVTIKKRILDFHLFLNKETIQNLTSSANIW